MTLWTIQHKEWYLQLLQQGSISGSRNYISQDWAFCLLGYNWMMNKMDERMGKRPFPDCFPIWAWYQYKDIKSPKPDLRSKGFLPKGTKGVCIEIKKAANEVLLSDFMLWHFPFCYHSFIGHNQQASEAFDNMLEQRGLSETHFTSLPIDIRQTIISSWDLVLDLDFEDDYHTSPKSTKAIQATFWTLSIDEIVSVKEFIAR